MRVAVLSDIHANIEAFQAVVSDLEHRTDRILNLGDLVGYNASPNECVELASDIGMQSIQGNHDQAAYDLSLAESFNIFARKAILWTRSVLSKNNMLSLHSLPLNCRFTYALGKVASVEIPLDGTVKLNEDGFYLLNPGSVGQPRNGDPRSSYFIFDTQENTLRFRLVEYDLSETIKKIMNANLPELFAERLVHGT
ncbi:MAG: metallophosphoesterase family protein [Deltaproteobacteria bacterium]|nr:metallophosphoesterase family protein [Deltaproteobacteria bacterium]